MNHKIACSEITKMLGELATSSLCPTVSRTNAIDIALSLTSRLV